MNDQSMQFLDALGIEAAGSSSAPDFEDDFLWLQFDPRIVPLAEANIATDMVPQVNSELRPGSRIKITGYDGTSLADPKYRWFDDLRNWIELGCDIDYVIINPCPAAIERLLQLSARGSESSGSFYGYAIKSDGAASIFDQSLIRRWETFHFSLFEGSGVRQMWIEGNHPRNSMKAHDCYYYGPSLAGASGIFDILASQFEHIVRSSSACRIEPAIKQSFSLKRSSGLS